MSLRTGHGRGRGRPHIEVSPVDELPTGAQATVHAEAGEERRANGTWTSEARTAQAKGGRARKQHTALANRIGLGHLAEDDAFAPYKSLAARFSRVHRASLAASVGGGICASGPSSMVASAALALAGSRFLYDTAKGDAAILAQASRLANDSRQNLLAAHELCAREAESRPREDPIARLRRETAERIEANRLGGQQP